MTTWGYKTIKDKLVELLGEVTEIKVVYGKEEKAVGQFPAACVSAISHYSRFDSMGSSGTNERVYNHLINVYFRVDENNDADYEDVLEGVADAIIAKLETDPTLGDTIEYGLPSSAVWHFGEKETPVRVFEITFTSTVHIRRDNGDLV